MIAFYQNWRLFLIITFFVLAFGGVITRMIMIQTNQGLFLQSAGNAQNQSIREISVKPVSYTHLTLPTKQPV